MLLQRRTPLAGGLASPAPTRTGLAAENANPLSRWGAPTWNPCQDSTWRPVPGLGSSPEASFSPHNPRDRHLRHTRCVPRCDPIGTTAERADATFQVGHRPLGRPDRAVGATPRRRAAPTAAPPRQFRRGTGGVRPRDAPGSVKCR
ncbi:AbfB domain-containing protein [Actinosynnema sp. NPDC053489]|uniref:AbfB domain-containing protein n=1 Tax=Actinosynnema sp. NPDC053489 TaxID=3363916 RepID=UPI0037CC2EB8